MSTRSALGDERPFTRALRWLKRAAQLLFILMLMALPVPVAHALRTILEPRRKSDAGDVLKRRG